MKNEEHQQKINDIISGNTNPEIEFGAITEIDQSGTNSPQGDFIAYVGGVIHPCVLSSSHPGGFYIDDKKAYDHISKICREYTKGQPIHLGVPVYEKGGIM